MTKSSQRLSGLSKQSHLVLGGVVAAGALVSGSAQAELIITDINQTASNGTIFIDVNGDWVNDFAITSFEAGGQSMPLEYSDMKQTKISLNSFADIKGLGNFAHGGAVAFDGAPTDKILIAPGSTGRVLIDTTQRGQFVERLDGGDSVSGMSGKFNTFGTFYQGNLEGILVEPQPLALAAPTETIIGPFADIGDTGYIGLSLTFGEDICCDFELSTVELLEIDEPYIEEQKLEVYYGWAEVVRGSLQVIRIGFQSTPFTAAQIPGGPIGVSEPATLPLIALGAAGLMGLRRRKNKAA